MSDVAAAYDEQMLPDPLPGEPFGLVKRWFDEAHEKQVQPNPNAMTVATIDPDGKPSARVVLCKDLRPEEGCIVFYTNYEGRKGRALRANPWASAVFHWDPFDRQVRIEGPVLRSPPEESDAYFATRAWQSRLGAWSSDQSEPIESREALIAKVAEAAEKLGIDLQRIVDGDMDGVEIPRPPHWGGFRIYAERVELWCGGTGRVHDRAEWTRALTRSGDSYTGGAWSMTRLQP
ncbi:MAG: pyridoxamine 5'-phosphate oxidase [Planctomycetota bacterium]